MKGVNPGAKVLLYLNGLIDFPAFRLHNLTNESMLLPAAADDPEGGRPQLAAHDVFDVRQPAMHQPGSNR